MFKANKISQCKIIDLGKTHQLKGNITVIENFKDIQFNINRVYYLYDVPGGVSRGGHAHKALFQLIVAASGSFDVEIFDGIKRQKYHLNQPNLGLFIVTGIWRVLDNFSSGSICLVLASDVYLAEDYIRDYDLFLNLKNN